MIIYAPVPQAFLSKRGEDRHYVVPPLRSLRRSAHLTATILHDLMGLGLSWEEIESEGLLKDMGVPAKLRSKEAIKRYILQNGRMIVDQYAGDTTHWSHSTKPEKRKIHS